MIQGYGRSSVYRAGDEQLRARIQELASRAGAADRDLVIACKRFCLALGGTVAT
jgi:hypothetical protein